MRIFTGLHCVEDALLSVNSQIVNITMSINNHWGAEKLTVGMNETIRKVSETYVS